MAMNASFLALTLCIVLSFAATCASVTTQLRSEADAYLSKLVDSEEFSGVVMVAHNGNVEFAKGYGLANREHEIPNTTDTSFRIASVTKQFTAMCILILHENGKLRVTDPICQFVKDCPTAWNKITIHHLLNHTSGIPSFTDFPDNLTFERLPTTVQATVLRFRDKPLDFEPGTEMSYSDSGYVLLGYIIERVSGTTFEDFLASRILRPLGMLNSGYDRPSRILRHRAAGYSKGENGEIINCVPFAMDTPHAAGAMYSTVGDLLKWDEALYSGRLVSRETMTLMFTPFTGDSGKGWFQNRGRYCYGWFEMSRNNRIQYEHPGEICGYVAQVIRDPKERLYIAVLSNNQWVDAFAVAEKLHRIRIGPPAIVRSRASSSAGQISRR